MALVEIWALIFHLFLIYLFVQTEPEIDASESPSAYTMVNETLRRVLLGP